MIYPPVLFGSFSAPRSARAGRSPQSDPRSSVWVIQANGCAFMRRIASGAQRDFRFDQLAADAASIGDTRCVPVRT
jgi:hypothetical protein